MSVPAVERHIALLKDLVRRQEVEIAGLQEQKRELAGLTLRLRDLVKTLWLHAGDYERRQLTSEQKRLYDGIASAAPEEFNVDLPA